jgi:hypothetical protein
MIINDIYTMIGILTGDIINSRKIDNPQIYLEKLKSEFNESGKQGKDWEIYRGDSFQVMMEDIPLLFEHAVILKAAVKTIDFLDVRVAMGIGEINFRASSISESNGEAFVRSGDCLNRLFKEQVNLGMSSPWENIDEKLNIMFILASPIMDSWTNRMAEAVFLSLKFKNKTQKEIGEMMGTRQNAVSELLSRARFKEISLLNNYFKKEIQNAIGDLQVLDLP